MKEKSISERAAKKSATILIVDDEDLIRELIRLILEDDGYQVIEAVNGHEALAMCRQSDCAIDLVISDVVMPQMDGRALAGKLAEICPQLPLIFTSGRVDNAFGRIDIIRADTNFIQKPFTVETLINKVREVLNKTIAQEQNFRLN